jgi:hypothetical protein
MRSLLLLLLTFWILAACGPVVPEGASVAEVEREGEVDGEAAGATATAGSTAASPTLEILTDDDRSATLRRLTSSWDTNWEKRLISSQELLSGGPPRDGIPSIDNPRFVSQAEAESWLAGREPVIALEINGDARAYPLQILTWHEIVNDEVGGLPVAVTFCPLCNAAVVFERQRQGQPFELGVSGLLRKSDMVMYDRTTETLWQQLDGLAIIGDLAGERLTFLPSFLVSFDDFRQAYPDGVVLSRDTGHNRRYGQNPYVGYDQVGSDPFLFQGEIDRRLPAVERVVALTIGALDVAYPFSLLVEAGVVHDTVDGREIVIFHAPGTSSALGAILIAEAEDVGATAVFDRYLNDQKLTFTRQGDRFVDAETSTTWNIIGQGLDGPLAGEQLNPIIHANHFWFAWAAFKPDTLIYGMANDQ